jgi:hypothetical protein
MQDQNVTRFGLAEGCLFIYTYNRTFWVCDKIQIERLINDHTRKNVHYIVFKMQSMYQ